MSKTLTVELGAGDGVQAAGEVLAVLVAEAPLERQRTLVHLDQAMGGGLLAHLSAVRFRGKRDEQVDIPTLGRIPARRLVVVGLGGRRGPAVPALRAAVAVAARAALGATSLGVLLGDHAKDAALTRAAGEGAALGAYTFTRYLTGERSPKQRLASITLYREGRWGAAERRAVELGVAVGSGVNLARDAVNEPPNVLTPQALAELGRRVAREGKLKVTVMDEKALASAGMNLHLAVGQGSANPPRLIHLTYSPPRPRARVVLVGKGLTFDSGGLCIKPAEGMGDMKSDMGGAAAVLGTLAAVAALRPSVEVHGIVAAAENMPDGNAYRPADVFTSLDGKTVEIINTDAEGRLVLADALTYARRLEPDLLVDAATLTGACMVALGKSCSGFYTASDGLARGLEAAARAAGDQFWRMPL
ncbi:MAG: leucyl aminopeptidase, partial [Deltaproteobacteria bacterium]|nr:leucyl aminopeptidase [Deltaproteobacteria bacterium]